jgi:daunosaminyl-N,N-dimethyltransferase/N-dimethyltransferase
MEEDRRIYGERAGLYDLIYHWLDYSGAAARLAEVLSAEGVPAGGRVLEAACGTGSYVRALAGRYRMTGFDVSEAMLALSREKNPDVPHFRADMANFTVDEPFDALLCLFSSIGYLHGEGALRSGLRCFARALRPGGVLVIEPWIARETFREGHVHLDTYASDDVKIARASHSSLRGELAVVDFHWVVARTGRGVEHFTESHHLWFCPRGTMTAALADAGFSARFRDEGLTPGRGLWVAKHDH